MRGNGNYQKTLEDLRKKLQTLYEEVARELKILREEYRACPKGDVYIRKRNGHEYFHERLRDEERPISRNKERVFKLIRKRVIENEIRCREIFCHHMDKAMTCIDKDLEKESRRKYSLTLKRIYSSEKPPATALDKAAEEWRSGNYVTNPRKPELKKYSAAGGIMVRSKSEKIIADRLWAHGVKFRYEAQFLIEGREFYPDFTIRLKDGKLIIWEHFGLLDNNEYADNASRKLDLFRRAGYKQHTNLICTDEDDIKSLEKIDDIILRWL